MSAAQANGRLFDDEEFFAAAERGELPAARPGCAEPDRHSALGAATLPRPAADTPAPRRRRAKPARTRRRPPPPAAPPRTSRETRPRRAPAPRRRQISAPHIPRRAVAAALGGGCIVVLLVVALAPRGPRAVSPSPVARPAVALPPVLVMPARAPSSALDVVSPRLTRLAGASALALSGRSNAVRLSATVADGGRGVERVTLLANGRPLATAAPLCRRACPSAARFRFQLRPSRLARPVALALVAADHAGNRALLWQRLLAPVKRRATARLTATFAGRPAAELTLPRGATYTLGGQLTSPAGSALRRRRVEVLAVSRSASARPRTLARAMTDAAGRWATPRLRARRGELLIARSAASPSVASSRALELAVRSPLSARRLGGRVVGRLGPGARGVTLVLARRVDRRWRALARTRAAVDGRYRLRLPPAARRGQLALFTGESASWPFAPASRLLTTR